jgi:hypothetical protein
MRTPAILAALLVLSAPAASLADDSPQTLAMELRFGFYTPDIDSEFDKGVTPYDTVFGSDSAWMFGLELDSQLWHGFGSLGAFGLTSYGYLSGHGISQDGTDSSDETTMSFLPLVAGLVYRFDVLAVRYDIPFVLVLKGGLNYTIWWIRDGVEEISEIEDADGSATEGSGGTFGLYGAASLHLLLDFFEPHTAKVFDNDLGVNNSYLFVEYAFQKVDDFGSDSSFDLSDSGLVFGLAFEM